MIYNIIYIYTLYNIYIHHIYNIYIYTIYNIYIHKWINQWINKQINKWINKWIFKIPIVNLSLPATPTQLPLARNVGHRDIVSPRWTPTEEESDLPSPTCLSLRVPCPFLSVEIGCTMLFCCTGLIFAFKWWSNMFFCCESSL